jgi:hypothetical protein
VSSSSKRRGSLDSDLEAQTPVESRAFVSKVLSIFRSNDKAAPPASMIVNVKTQTEEHTSPVQVQQFDPDQSRWRTVRGQADGTFAETGL